MNELEESLILSGDEIGSLGLFAEGSTEQANKENENNTITEEQDNLKKVFLTEETPAPESVGNDSNKDAEGIKETPSETIDGSSSDSNFYYSIAKAFVEDGVLPDLSEDEVKGIKSPEDLAEAIDKQVSARLTEAQQRVEQALNAGMEPDEIRQYETVLRNLDAISEDALTAETEQAETLRKNLIYQDLINRGFSKERASREVKKSVDSGSDIEDAKDALMSNKDYFKEQYNSIVEEGRKAVKAEKEKQQKAADDLKKQMLEDKEIFEGITLDKSTRQKAYDSVTKPVYKTDDGTYLTALQKYERDNPVEFRKKIGVLFAVTNGFKDLNTVVKSKVKKEVGRSLRELEHTLKGGNSATGNLSFMGGMSSDSSSNGWLLAD